VVPETFWRWHATDRVSRWVRDLRSQPQFLPVTPGARSRAKIRSGVERDWCTNSKRRHLHGILFFSIFDRCSQKVRFRSSSTPLPWASSTTRSQNAQKSFQSHLRSVAQGLLFIFRQKIKQSTTSWLWSKPSLGRKKLQGSYNILPQKAARPGAYTKRFLGGRNPGPNKFPGNCTARTPIDSIDNRLDSTLRGRFTVPRTMGALGYVTIQLEYRRCTIGTSKSTSAS
jgi:hypothetical protein